MPKFFSLFVFTLLIAACGQTRPASVSRLAERQAIPMDLVTAADVRTFLDDSGKLAGATDTGTFGVDEFLKVIPMHDDQRAVIAASYASPFSVTCANGRCSAVASGAAVEATMSVKVTSMGMEISDPDLALGDSLTTDYVMRGPDAVEFCKINGMSVKKLFITKKVQGLKLELKNGKPSLTANIGDDDQNYTCD